MHSLHEQIALTKICSNGAQMCQEIAALVIKHGTRNEISKAGLARVFRVDDACNHCLPDDSLLSSTCPFCGAK